MSRKGGTADPQALLGQGRFVRAGRLLEAQGRIHEAVQAYAQGACWREAGRALSAAGQHLAAARALLRALPDELTPLASLSEDQRHAALEAAVAFARGKAIGESVSILVNLGERRRAASLLAASGKRELAERALRGDPLPALRWPAGSLSSRPVTGPAAGEPRRSEPAQPAATPSHGLAGYRATEISNQVEVAVLDNLDGEVDCRRAEVLLPHAWRHAAERLPGAHSQFLERLLDGLCRGGALRPEAVPLAYALGRLFEFHYRVELAQTAYRAISDTAPNRTDAAQRCANLDQGLAATDNGAWLPEMYLGSWGDPAPLPPLATLPGPLFPAGGATCLLPPTPAPAGASSSRRALAAQDFFATGQDISQVVTTVDPELLRSAAATSSALEQGTELIDDRYRVLDKLGSGGMAVVYRVRDEELGQELALKLFRSGEDDELGLARFRREMAISRQLRHHNIVRTYEFGAHQGARYYTMEVLSSDLASELTLRGAELPLREVLTLGSAICGALQHAHENHVVHRDLKPSNIGLADGEARLMDFGLARHTTRATINVTGKPVGTPHYVSPEGIKTPSEVGPPADIYAMGAVLYELLTGGVMFREATLVRLLYCHLHETPEPIDERRPDLDFPPSLVAVVARTLKKAPTDRFSTARELGEALDSILDALPAA